MLLLSSSRQTDTKLHPMCVYIALSASRLPEHNLLQPNVNRAHQPHGAPGSSESLFPLTPRARDLETLVIYSQINNNKHSSNTLFQTCIYFMHFVHIAKRYNHVLCQFQAHRAHHNRHSANAQAICFATLYATHIHLSQKNTLSNRAIPSFGCLRYN